MTKEGDRSSETSLGAGADAEELADGMGDTHPGIGATSSTETQPADQFMQGLAGRNGGRASGFGPPVATPPGVVVVVPPPSARSARSGPNTSMAGRPGSSPSSRSGRSGGPASSLSGRMGAVPPSSMSGRVAVPPSSVSSSMPENEPVDPRVGATFGKYHIVRRLGRGGMGTVYQGEDTVLKRNVAIKFLPDDVVNKPEVVERFLREAQVAGRLNHPNIIAIYDIAKDNNGCYMVMELLDPGSARSRMNKGPYPWPVATRIIADCCAALAIAHEAGIIHRDIKPDNILFSSAGVVKLCDFGLVKLIEDDLHLTQTGMLCGTPLYMSPEQASNQEMDGRSDLYSLGATYFALLTGRPPYVGPGVPQILLGHVQGKIPDPRQVVPSIPEACSKVVNRAMAKKPEDRYANAAQMGDDLEAILTGISPRNSSIFAMDSGRMSGDNVPVVVGRTSSFAGQEARTLAGLLRGPGGSSSSGLLTRRSLLALGGLAAIGAGVGLWARHQSSTVQPVKPDPIKPPVGPDPKHPPTPAVKLPPIKVGILHSLSGPLSVSERPLRDATQLAIEEINAAGGLLGRRIEAHERDGKSQVTANSAYTQGADELLNKEKVAVIFGGFGSASRKLILPFVEDSHRLLFYPAQYEGLEQSESIIYTGATPNQNVIPSIHWAVEELKVKRFFFIGTDGLRARAINAIAEDTVRELHGEVLGEEYALVGESQFAHVVKKLKHLKPQIIINDLVGDSNISFFRALVEAGMTPDMVPVLSYTLGENELAQLGSLSLAGQYVARTRFPALPGAPPGADFAARFKKKYGEDRVVSELMESAYYGALLWAAAVRKADSEDTGRVRAALLEKPYDVNGVQLRIDPSTQHTYKVFQLGKIVEKNAIQVIKTDEKPTRPIPFPPPRTPTEWKNFSDELYTRWGNNWSNPQKPQLKRPK